MTTRSPHDYIVQRKEDGWSADYWLSDSESGRREIARLEAEAYAARTVNIDAIVRQAVAAEVKKHNKRQDEQLECLTEGIAQAYKRDRQKLREQLESDFRELRLEVENGLLAVKQRAARLAEQEAELEQQRKKLKVIGGRGT
jgi:DNA anti-recombination protein RmuC